LVGFVQTVCFFRASAPKAPTPDTSNHAAAGNGTGARS